MKHWKDRKKIIMTIKKKQRTATLSSVKLSREMDLTLVRCEPKLLWMPLQSMQMNTPKLRSTQSGSEHMQTNKQFIIAVMED